MGQQVDMWSKNKISSKLPQIGSKLPQDIPVHENIVPTSNKQTQNELLMFEVGGFDGGNREMQENRSMNVSNFSIFQLHFNDEGDMRHTRKTS